MCRTRHFRRKGQCATEIQLLNTPHDRRCCRHASDDATLMQFDWHALVPGKHWRVHFRHRGWGRQRYLPPRLRGDMATPTTIALDSSFNLLLISRILVDSDGNCQHHVIIGINHGLVCVVDINSLVGCLASSRNLWLLQFVTGQNTTSQIYINSTRGYTPKHRKHVYILIGQFQEGFLLASFMDLITEIHRNRYTIKKTHQNGQNCNFSYSCQKWTWVLSQVPRTRF